MIRVLVLLLALLAGPIKAEEIVSGLSQSMVSINANFDGTAILIYGAAVREGPPPDWPLLQVIITVEGPQTPLVIRKKEHVAGLWINRGSLALPEVPSFYAVMATGALSDILSPEEDAKYRISIEQEIGLAAATAADAPYLEALQRIRAAAGTYQLARDSVLLLQQALFRTEVALPSNLIEGDYKVRIFLTRGGKVIDTQESQISVSKDGVERFLFNLAQEQPFLYGLLSLAMAGLAGWGASALFRRFRF